MCPDPTEVRSWFADALNDAALSRYVATLRADPNWRAVQFQGGGRCTLKLLYFPTGVRLEILLAWKATHWMPL